MPDKKRTSKAKAKQAEVSEDQADDGRVLASTLDVGDKIYFPNGRHAQAIESIVDVGDGDGVVVRRLTAGDATWTVQPNFEIRKG